MSTDSNHSDQLERYLSGAMSPEEAHAFERAVLDDPFLAEALEGYEEHRPGEIMDDLARLRGKLKKGQQKNSWSLMKIAAAAALLIAAGLSVWFVATDQATNPEELALQEQPKAAATPDNENPPELEKKPPAELSGTSATEIQRPNVKEIVAKAAPDKRAEPTTKEQSPPPATVLKEARERVDADDLAQDVPPESASRIASRMSKKSITAEPSAMEITPTADKEEMEVALDVEVLEETVVEDISFAAAPVDMRKLDSNFASGQADQKGKPIMRKGISTVQYTAEPTIGWEAYREYLSDSLRYPKKAAKLGIEGRVSVQAELTQTGEIDTAYIIKGIQGGCDQEALRLVLEGPKFEPDSTLRKVIIPVIFEIK